MSPILVRPVREQLEHDRIIRLLHAKFRRKYEAGMNPGTEQNAPVGTGPSALYPGPRASRPLERGRKLQAVVEVETGESVNHLEALAQWAHFAQAPRGVPPLRSGGNGRRRAPAVRGQPDPRRAKSGATTSSATSRASRWCTAARKRRPWCVRSPPRRRRSNRRRRRVQPPRRQSGRAGKRPRRQSGRAEETDAGSRAKTGARRQESREEEKEVAVSSRLSDQACCPRAGRADS